MDFQKRYKERRQHLCDLLFQIQLNIQNFSPAGYEQLATEILKEYGEEQGSQVIAVFSILNKELKKYI